MKYLKKGLQRVSALAVFAGCVALLPFTALAQNFPTKPITIVAHTAAGSSTDLFARELALAAAPIFGKPVVVVNRPGGSGATQMSFINSAEPDGYTVGVNTGSHVTAMLTNLKGTYTPKDFSWIMLNQIDPYILAVHVDSPYKSLKDLVEAAKGGERVKIGGYGAVGASHNIAVQILAEKAGMPITWVSYPGSGDAATAVLGKHIDAVSINPGGTLAFVSAGRIRILAVMNENRVSSLPDVPTYAEAGYDVDTSWKQIRGLYGPKDIPMDIQEKLADGFFKAMETPRFKEYMKRSALESGNLGPDEYPQFIDETAKATQQWLTKLGITQ
ncbi:hypothetical protein CR155_03710 [Pollutimonas nitritireducens]|uniref:Tricarboxylate transport protein TctC n=1 Tax=Pollutimonas nitritireducens TaxID=2045209 RepID=A0A2N4UJY9_9BURK|nr:tripartite tricarboxylate transporter substrate binding protein [Pollutimonas nitritireducens]PLC55320.1 hypothetical protein CR155_03710 [Pollutimonas nitritireducens]